MKTNFIKKVTLSSGKIVVCIINTQDDGHTDIKTLIDLSEEESGELVNLI